LLGEPLKRDATVIANARAARCQVIEVLVMLEVTASAEIAAPLVSGENLSRQFLPVAVIAANRHRNQHTTFSQ
jgi:hypothetical protein